MSAKIMAELFGGPGDGRLVELLGPCYQIMVEYVPGRHERRATYRWDVADDGTIKGIYVGTERRRLES